MNKTIYTILLLCFSLVISAQEKKNIDEMTKEDVLELSYDELLEMPFEDLLRLADIVGVSLDELYEMLLNKDVVSASKKVESSFDAPLSTSVISYDEIIASGCRSIEEALRLVPGLIIREKTNGNFDIHIRGNDNTPPKHMLLYSENSITLVMIDNRPVYNYAHGGTFWETLPVGIDDVERIEVIRGPSSALYGPNAVSGVVNIITKKTDSKKLDLDGNVQVGTQNSLITSMGIGQKVGDKLSFRLTGNFETLDRNTDKLYVYKANNGVGGFISKEVLDTLRDSKGFYVFDPADDVNDMYPNPENSRKRMGVNGYIDYSLNEDILFNLKGGYQSSEVNSTTMGDNPSSLAGRISNTYYSDFNANIHGLRAQFNYMGGVQDIVRQDTGFKVDIKTINANVEYDFNFGSLNIRPGYSYQLTKYNDLEYLRYVGQGFLNGEKALSTNALSLRADYKFAESMRLIGAVRGEKYNTHEDLFLTYQLIFLSKITHNSNIRLVYSKANRSPFLVDSYANYFWDREGRDQPGYIKFEGQENLDLLTMNMIELGFRVKPRKNIMVDVDFFYTQSQDFGALYPDSANMNGALTGEGKTWVRMKYVNIDLTAAEFGGTATISWVANENLLFKLFGTYQKSKLKNSIVKTQDDAIVDMLGIAMLNPDGYTTSFPPEREDILNSATPTFYGGAIINYTTLKNKLRINLNTYFYTKQDFYSKYIKIIDNSYPPVRIVPKLILNAKVSYKIVEPLDVYVNARNILGAKNEFAFMDDIGNLIFLGLTFDF